MKHGALTLLTFLLVSSAVHAGQERASITGLWLTKKRDAAVRVETCGEEICGYIAWLHADEAPYSITGAPLCQAQVLKGFKRSENDKNIWEGGTVYKADDDKTYRGVLKLLDESTVELRAYIAVLALGKTKVLTRTTPQDYPPCDVPIEPLAVDTSSLNN